MQSATREPLREIEALSDSERETWGLPVARRAPE